MSDFESFDSDVSNVNQEIPETREKKTGNGDFFAIDGRNWHDACKLGMNVAVSYLVQAVGTQRDNKTTSWSVNAIESHTGIGRHRAKNAISTMQDNNLIRKTRGGKFPKYEILTWSERTALANLSGPEQGMLEAIGKGEDLPGGKTKIIQKLLDLGLIFKDDTLSLKMVQPAYIWLPNAIVEGAVSEIPPVELLRQSQQPMALRFFVDLYSEQNLAEDGGIDRSVIYKQYEREKIVELGAHVIWGFVEKCLGAKWGKITEAYRLEDEESPGSFLFECLKIIEDTGLLVWVPYLVESESPDAEVLHPLASPKSDPIEIEERIGEAAADAAFAMLEKFETQQVDSHVGPHRRAEGYIQGEIAPVIRHMANVQLIGIARMRYRPRTGLTAAWWAELHEKGEQVIAHYDALSGDKTSMVSMAS